MRRFIGTFGALVAAILFGGAAMNFGQTSQPATQPADSAKQAAAATLITIHMHDAPAKAVYDELFRQEGCGYSARTFSWGNVPDRVTLDVDRMPFWDAYAKLPDMSQRSLQIAGGGPVANGPHVEQGAILIVPRTCSYGSSITYDPAGAVRRNFLGLAFSGYVEPKVPVVTATQNMQVLEAVDDHGNNLKYDYPNEGLQVSIGGGWWPLHAQLQLPAKNPGARLARFRAKVTVRVCARINRVEIPDLDVAGPKTMNVSGGTVQFLGCLMDQTNPDIYRITLKAAGLSPDKLNLVWTHAADQIRVTDADGAALQLNDVENDPDDLNERQLDYTRMNLPSRHRIGVPLKLTWNAPGAFVDIDVPVEFKDLPMNFGQ